MVYTAEHISLGRQVGVELPCSKLVCASGSVKKLARGALLGSLLVAPATTAIGETIVLRAARALDPVEAVPIAPASIVIDSKEIKAVGRTVEAPPGARILDLGDVTILPGFIDAHTHLLADGSPDYGQMLYRQSTAARAIAATAAARRALEYGFTTLRDMGSEGTGYADVDLKRAIGAGVVPGPRLRVSTRAISTPGGYQPAGWSWELALPMGAQIVTGVEECRRAVREQIAGGADWIKVYADWDFSAPVDGELHGRPNFTPEELSTIVAEAQRAGIGVAAHATTIEGIEAALDAGVRSIEHGNGFTDDLLRRAAAADVTWCPTLLPIDVALAREPDRARVSAHKALRDHAVARGRELGVRMALGSDAGSVPWSVNPAREFQLLVRDGGFSPIDAIRAGTLEGARLLGGRGRAGRVAEGYVADLVAVPGDPLEDVSLLQEVVFVMKSGVVVRNDQQ